MLEESEARRRVLESVEPCRAEEQVPLADALDRLLARDVLGQVDLPGFDHSTMDGYAVRAADAAAGATLSVRGTQPAGADLGLEVLPGSAVRVFTGAPLPRGADAVVMQEDVELDPDTGEARVVEGVVPGENVAKRGGDACAGQRLLAAGLRLTPPRLGLLASQGMAAVAVRPRPRVGIVTTGDELAEVGTVRFDQLPPGHLFNSNGPMLEAFARRAGAAARRWHAPDDPAALEDALARALEGSDFLIVAGGVSVGERDLVKAALERLGVRGGFWRVKVKPGKPFLFGRREGQPPAHVFGLPGNPVAAFVTFAVFALPALARWSGESLAPGEQGMGLRPWRARCGAAFSNPSDRPHYLRVKLDPATGELAPCGLQQSHALHGLSQAQGLLRLEAGARLDPGDEADAWLF